MDYLVPRAGEAVSREYIGRLRAYCEGFETFPKRGTVRTDHLPGLRVVGFERNASVAFVVEDDSVIILRISTAARLSASRTFKDNRPSDAK